MLLYCWILYNEKALSFRGSLHYYYLKVNGVTYRTEKKEERASLFSVLRNLLFLLNTHGFYIPGTLLCNQFLVFLVLLLRYIDFRFFTNALKSVLAYFCQIWTPNHNLFQLLLAFECILCNGFYFVLLAVYCYRFTDGNTLGTA